VPSVGYPLRLAKRSIYANADLDLRDALQVETMAQNRAFGEKRAPVFKGR